LHLLEVQAGALIEAVGVLAGALEGGPAVSLTLREAKFITGQAPGRQFWPAGVRHGAGLW
jgi:hypothetical protein